MPEQLTQSDSDQRKRAILREMGVDVWVLRAERQVLESSPPVSPTDHTPLRQQVVHPDPAPAVDKPRKAALQDSAAARRPSQSPVSPPIPPFSVVCLSKGDVVLLIEPGRSKAALRFASDLLSAASSVWGGNMDRLAFDWPQPGIENNAATQTRALGAFVDKQLGDRAPGLILLADEVAGRLETLPKGCLRLPPMTVLMTQGEHKRALWEKLKERL